MTGAGAVVALLLVEWATGLLAGAAWTQSWGVVRRGHFRIVAWTGLALAALGLVAARDATDPSASAARALAAALVGGAALYLVLQRARGDAPGAAAGALAGALGVGALGASAALLGTWPGALAVVELVAGAALLGAVTNGMLLGHWYLNQPGLKPWALARLTAAALVATAATAALGLAAAPRLAGASTTGAVLGIPGFGESFGGVFFGVWVALVAFTAAVVWAARRCVAMRSIQSATGLYYVALLTAGVSEFVVRYLMVNAT